MKFSRTKYLVTAVFAILLLTALTTTTTYASGIIVEIDGVQVDFDGQNPANIDGRILVPVRGVFEALGFTVAWNPDTQTATLTGENVIVITIGSSTFTTDGRTYTLDVPAQIIGGRTMLPIRAVLESVGHVLEWDGARTAVLITTNPIGISTATPNETVRVTAPVSVSGNLSNLSDFSEGIAWVDYSNVTTAINTAGEAIFTTAAGTGRRWNYRSPFQDGTAFLISTSTIGMNTIADEVAIVDRAGNYLFRRAGDDFNILAYGDGMFIVAELTSGFAAHQWQVGAIDRTGNIVVPMRPYPNSNTDFSQVERGEIEYLGSGIFQLAAVDREGRMDAHVHIFNLHTNEIIIDIGEYVVNPSIDIRLLSNFANGYAIASVDVEFYGMFEAMDWRGVGHGIYRIDLNGQPVEQLGTRALHHNVREFSADGLVHVNGAFFNRLGELVVEVPSIQGIGPSYVHPMINGYAIVEYRGADGNIFFTVMNVDGEIMFDPITIGNNQRTLYRCTIGDHVIINTPGQLSIYTTHGDLVSEITGGSMIHGVGRYGAAQIFPLSEGLVRFNNFFVNIFDGRIITAATEQ